MLDVLNCERSFYDRKLFIIQLAISWIGKQLATWEFRVVEEDNGDIF